ncbi:MAG: exo-alpha-sialidase [Spirochaetota bacterium]
MTSSIDTRNITAGANIPSEGYCDQPYIIKADDGAWVCTMTTGTGHEGDKGQHVITMRSFDRGVTWIERADVEPAAGPEASYSVVFKAPYGRIYCLYNYNGANVREVKREDSGVFTRVDSLGDYVFKYSDDNGKSWSKERYNIPVREFECDRKNVYAGKLRFFWNVGRPITTKDGKAIFVLHKVGAMGDGFFAQSEGVFLKSDNILTERDPKKVNFATLPDGDIGLRAPAGGGRVSEEHTIVELSDGSLYSVYRTIDGYPACAYSRDGGHTWTKPAYARYTPNGKKIKHPRAANFVWKCENGKYLYWYHNHGGAKFIANKAGWVPYADRNPAWITGGIEKDGHIHWSEPEVLLYDDELASRMSYPDLVEDGGEYYVTETQKTVARVHHVDKTLIEGLWAQAANKKSASEGILFESKKIKKNERLPDAIKLPPLHMHPHQWGGKNFTSGFSIEMRIRVKAGTHGVLFNSRDSAGRGTALTLTDRGTISLFLSDGHNESSWESDGGLITPSAWHHITAIVDGGPNIIMFVIDGKLCDGGEERQFGWGRIHPSMTDVSGDVIHLSCVGECDLFRIYGRALRVSEAVGNAHAAY